MIPGRRRRLAAGVFALLFLALPATAGDPAQYVEEWEGIWEVTTTIRDCKTGNVLSQVTILDTICAGDPYDQIDPEGIVDCAGEIDDNSLAIQCFSSVALNDSCDVVIESDVTGTLGDGTFSAMGRTTTTFVGECGLPDLCTDIEFSGTRTSQAPCDQTPIVVESWGAVKARYR